MAQYGVYAMPDGSKSPQTLLRFPPTFNVYTSKRFSSKLTYIDPTGSQPMYVLSTHHSPGKPELVLHNGVNKDDPWLATSTAESAYHGNPNTVAIPALDQETSTTTLSPKLSWKHLSFLFSIAAGLEKEDVRPGQFEWRQTRGKEVEGLKGSSKGWKLVRLSSRAQGEAVSSDNKEIVAVFSNPKTYFTNDFEFRFLGSALTGCLGERFEIMAVITALRIWYLRFQPNMGDSSASST